MGEFTFKGVGSETELPQRTVIRGDAHNVVQPVLTEHNIMDWVIGLVFAKSLKSSTLYGIDLEFRFSDMWKIPECLVHMPQHPVVGQIQASQYLLVVPFSISTSDTVPRS